MNDDHKLTKDDQPNQDESLRFRQKRKSMTNDPIEDFPGLKRQKLCYNKNVSNLEVQQNILDNKGDSSTCDIQIKEGSSAQQTMIQQDTDNPFAQSSGEQYSPRQRYNPIEGCSNMQQTIQAQYHTSPNVTNIQPQIQQSDCRLEESSSAEENVQQNNQLYPRDCGLRQGDGSLTGMIA